MNRLGLVVCLCGAVACGDKTDKQSDTETPVQEPAEDAGSPGVDESLAEIVASLAKVTGPVEIRRRGGSAWEPATVGAVLREGDLVRTGDKGTARIRFAKRGFVDLEEATSLAIDLKDVEGAQGVVLALEEGSVAGTVDGDSDREQPLLVRSADGTETRLTASGGGAAEFRLRGGKARTQISVRKGRLRASRAGTDTDIGEGQAADLTNEGVGEVISLIPFPVSIKPGIDARYRYEDALSIGLAWKPVDDAVGYRIQIASDLAFHALVVTEQVNEPGFSFAPPGAGTYVWRVASIDSDGRTGEYGFARRMYCETEPPTDLLVGPPDGEVVAYDKKGKVPSVTFSWQSSGDASEYRLVLRDLGNPDGKPILSQVTSQQSITVDVQAGRYSWGVYAVGEPDRPLFVSGRKLLVERRKAPKAKTKGMWD